MTDNFLVLAAAGLLSGILAGFLGIGGGTILVPIMVRMGYAPVEAVATSSLAIVVTSITGSWQNWRMGFLDLRKVLLLGFPALVTAQLGVFLANVFPPPVLLTGFGLMLISNVYLVGLRQQVVAQSSRQEAAGVASGDRAIAPDPSPPALSPFLARLITGGSAGFLAGLFGVGGGVIMVPLQILLLGEKIKPAVQTSLGVIVITAIAACIGHATTGNVLFQVGLTLGLGGLMGVQVSTRFLPKLPDQVVTLLFRTMLSLLSIYIFWQAWTNYLAAKPA